MRNYSPFVWLVFGLLSALLIALGLAMPIDHDEAQFIASGMMLAREQLHPILDYVYYHQPAYSYLYAFLFQLFSDPVLLIVRVFCGISSVLTLRLLLRHYFKRLKKEPYSHLNKVLFPIGFMVALAMTNGFAKGLVSWNHGFPSFLLLSAYLILLRNHRRYVPQKIGWAGVLFAFSVALRASLAPMVLPLFLGLFFYDLDWNKRLRLAGSFFVGCLIGSVPVFTFMALDTDAFFFNIVEFHTDYDEAYLASEGRAADLPERLRLAQHYLLQTNNLYFVVVALSVTLGFLIKRRKEQTSQTRFRRVFALLVFFMSILSAITKNVTFPQYYYLPMLLLAVLAIELYPLLQTKARKPVVVFSLFLAAALVIDGSSGYKRLVRAIEKDAPFMVFQSQQEGAFIRKHAGEGKVLTLSPIFPLEGGNSIYPEFVTSPFAFRTRDFVPKALRLQYNVIGEGDLDRYMKDKSPCAVYSGWERKPDRAIDNWAERNGFSRISTPMGKKLWIRP